MAKRIPEHQITVVAKPGEYGNVTKSDVEVTFTDDTSERMTRGRINFSGLTHECMTWLGVHCEINDKSVKETCLDALAQYLAIPDDVPLSVDSRKGTNTLKTKLASKLDTFEANEDGSVNITPEQLAELKAMLMAS